LLNSLFFICFIVIVPELPRKDCD